MLRVRRVAKDIQQFLVARWASTVFRRAGTFASQANRVLGAWLKKECFLHEDFMLPVVPPVVYVGKLALCYCDDTTQIEFHFVCQISACVQRCITVRDPFYDKLMEMDVCPTHHRLQNFVELVETDIIRDLYPSPNGRSDIFQGDLQLINENRSPSLPRLFFLCRLLSHLLLLQSLPQVLSCLEER